MIPWRVGQHMLQLLFIGIRNLFLHSLHVLFVRIRLHQTFQIVPDRLDNRARRLLKMRLETQMKPGESSGQVIERIDRLIRKKFSLCMDKFYLWLAYGTNIIINSVGYRRI